MNLQRNSLAYDGSVYLAVAGDGNSISGQIVARNGTRLTSFVIESASGGTFLGWQTCGGRGGSDPCFAVAFARNDNVTNPKVVRFVRYRDGAVTISDAVLVADLGAEVLGSEWGQVRWTGSDWAIAIRLRGAGEPRAVIVRMSDDGARTLTDLTNGVTFANGQALAPLPDGSIVAFGFLAFHHGYYFSGNETDAIAGPQSEDHQVVYREHLNDVLALSWGGVTGFTSLINGVKVGENLAPELAGGLAMAYSPVTRKTLVVAKTLAESTAVAFLIGDDGRPILSDVLTIVPWDGRVPAFYQSLVAGPAGEFAASTFLAPESGGSRIDIINTSGPRLAFGAGADEPPDSDPLKALIDVAKSNGIPWGIVALAGIGIAFIAFSKKS